MKPTQKVRAVGLGVTTYAVLIAALVALKEDFTEYQIPGDFIAASCAFCAIASLAYFDLIGWADFKRGKTDAPVVVRATTEGGDEPLSQKSKSLFYAVVLLILGLSLCDSLLADPDDKGSEPHSTIAA